MAQISNIIPPSNFTRNGATFRQYRIAQMNAAGDVSEATAATQILEGIIVDPGRENGDQCAIETIGEAIGEAGAAFDEGAQLTADADGQLIATTTVGNFIVAHAIEAATAAGDRVRVRVLPGHRRFAATA